MHIHVALTMLKTLKDEQQHTQSAQVNYGISHGIEVVAIVPENRPSAPFPRSSPDHGEGFGFSGV